ncbi:MULTISPECIES: ketopantoate reductase C-terminal domain-containing protein [Bacillus]|uniref:ketopantoate reductase C-terminal domain-containing protein n=1 Tax=Bacillus TaxID=1386 RepID=UPI001E4EF597|nr:MULTISPECIES: ketopantoate reductase C-terminal domain-containing protein [Bacillus]
MTTRFVPSTNFFLPVLLQTGRKKVCLSLKTEESYFVEWVWSAKCFVLVVPMGNPLPQTFLSMLGRGSSIEEAAQIMTASGAPIQDNIVDEHMKTIEKISYDMKSSMQRDMEKGSSIEVEYLQGYLLKLAKQFHIDVPLLKIVYQNLKIYEE